MDLLDSLFDENEHTETERKETKKEELKEIQIQKNEKKTIPKANKPGSPIIEPKVEPITEPAVESNVESLKDEPETTISDHFDTSEPEHDNSGPDNMTISPKVFVSELNIGDEVESIFAITRMNLREYDRGKFLTLRLGDKTGKISAVLWDQAEQIAKTLQDGCLVTARGKVNAYQGEPQLALTSILPLLDDRGINPTDFLPESPIPLDKMIQQFDTHIESMVDPDYKALLQAFRADEIWQKFITAPGAKLWHHPYIHGLLEHTLSVVHLCKSIAPSYPPVNQDLLVTGAIFHDSGKSIEFDYQYRINYSTEGRLLGHIFIGASLAERLIEAISNFPAQKRTQLLHLILSHHGETERSPILPMTLEAALLHHVENMDAQMMAFIREMGKAREENEEWTGYVNLIQRYLYVGQTNLNLPSDESQNQDTL